MSAPATTIRQAITLFAPIEKVSKQPDGTLIVDCVVSSEQPDDQGEIVTYDAIKKAAADYMTWANVREMHLPSAVGTTIELNLDDELRKATAQLHIVDAAAVQKVEASVYKGVSIGGRKTAFGALKKVGGKSLREVTGILWNELSLADRPSNPDTVLTLAKRAGGDDEAADEPAVRGAESPVEAPAVAPEELAQPAAVEAGSETLVTEDAGTVVAPAQDVPEGVTTPAADGDGTAGSEPAAVAAPAPEAVLAQASPAGDLKKSAVDDIRDANWVATDLATMIEGEGLDADSEDATELRQALAIVQAYAAKKGQEVGTPADVEERIEEIAESTPTEVIVVGSYPMYYAAVTGDLAKRALELAKVGGQPAEDLTLDNLVTFARAAGGRCEHDLAKVSTTDSPASIDSEALALIFDAGFERSSESLLAKVTTAIGPIVRPDALEAMKGELLEAMAPLKEELAKIAAQPAPGGPARFAMDVHRFGGDGTGFSAASEADVLTKAAANATDPVAKEALGRIAATAQIKAQQTGA